MGDGGIGVFCSARGAIFAGHTRVEMCRGERAGWAEINRKYHIYRTAVYLTPSRVEYELTPAG